MVGVDRRRGCTLRFVIRRLLATTLAVAALGTAAAPALAAPADHGQAALREARTLSVKWGRCPTSFPAHRMLAAAEKAPTAARAERARTAWRSVATACSAPVPTVQVVVGQ